MAQQSGHASATLIGVPRGFNVGVITGDEITGAPSLSAALAARVPGLSVMHRSGALGAGARVWLRGPTSLLVNEPMIIVDGIRVHAAQSSGMESGVHVSRLDDIDPATVERIEILRGIAAAATYGPEASKGVILITLRRGSRGPTRWTSTVESGLAVNQTTFPANFRREGVSTVDGTPVDYCPLRLEGSGSCTPTTSGSWNPLEQASPFRTGWNRAVNVSAGGGASAVTWFASGRHDRATGIFDESRLHATAARFALDVAPESDLDVALSAGYRTGRMHFPPRGGAGVLSAGLLGGSADDPVTRGYDPLYVARMNNWREDAQASDRLMAGARAIWRARPRLNVRASVGIDDVNRADRFGMISPYETAPGDTIWALVAKTETSRPQTITAGAEAVLSYSLRPRLAANTVLGIDYWQKHERVDRQEASSSGLEVTGLRDLAQSAHSSEHLNIRTRTLGVRLAQHVTWRERLAASALVRVDRIPGKAHVFDPIVSSSVDVSWMLIDPRNRGGDDWLSDARLRAAWGTGGDHLIPHIVPVNPSLPTPSGGPPRFPPERGTEAEFGADLSLFGGRVSAALTRYIQSVEHGLVPDFESLTDPSLPSPLFNPPVAAGDVDGDGWEAAIAARLVERSAIQWDVSAAYWTGGQSIDVAMAGRIVDGNTYIGPRNPIGGFWSRSYLYDDADGNGVLGYNEVTAQEDFLLLGTVHPTREASLRNAIGLGPVTLAATLDHRGGHRLRNDLQDSRCGLPPTCREASDPTTPLDAQARTLAAIRHSYRGFLDRGDFTRVRDVSLIVPFGARWIGQGATARITLTGRNLVTWTAFAGLDPEVSTAGSSPFTPPLPRSFVARFDLAW
jgi:hypothetical protein